MAGQEEIADFVMGAEETKPEQAAEVAGEVASEGAAPEKPAAKEADETAMAAAALADLETADDGAGKGAAPEKPAEETPTTADIDEVLKEVDARPTAPGGAPAGVIRDLQAERQARQEAQRRAEELERRIATLEAEKAPAGRELPTTVDDLIRLGRVSADDAVTAAMQVELERNRVTVAERQKAQEGASLTQQMDAQELSVAQVLSPERVGQGRDYVSVVNLGRSFLTPQDKAEIQQVFNAGGNAAKELYVRCRQRAIEVYPEMKVRLTGPAKSSNQPGAPVVKQKTTTEPGKAKVTQPSQDEILDLDTEDPEAVRDFMLGD